jgi:hypothetical protein
LFIAVRPATDRATRNASGISGKASAPQRNNREGTTIRLRATVKAGLGAVSLCLLAGTVAAQDMTLRWAMHPGSHTAPVMDYFIPL